MAQPALRPLSVGEILDVAFSLYRRHFVPLVMIALICTGVPQVLNLYIASAGGMFSHIGLWSVTLLLSLMLSMLAASATVFLISEAYLGRELGAAAALQRAMPFLGRLLALSVLTGVVIFLGFLLLLVPGFMLVSGLMLATQVLVLEGSVGAQEAMRRSWDLTNGFKGKMFLLVLTTGLIVYVPVIALTEIAGFLAAGTGAAAQEAAVEGASGLMLLLLAVSGLVQLIIYPLVYCMLTVAYYDLRVRKEGFDLEVLSGALQSP